MSTHFPFNSLPNFSQCSAGQMDWVTLRCSLFCKDFHVIIRRHVAPQLNREREGERERETTYSYSFQAELGVGRGSWTQRVEQPKQESKQTRSEAGSQNKRRQDIAPVTPTKGSAKAALESHSCVRKLQVAKWQVAAATTIVDCIYCLLN